MNTYTTQGQRFSAVASNTSGDFVVTWADASGQDGSYDTIVAQLYASDGSSLGGELLVNTYTTFSQWTPAVTAIADGSFVVSWQGVGPEGTEIWGQVLASDGSPLGGEFQINTHTTDFQRRPSITALSDSGFIVVWHSQDDQDGDSLSIHGRIYDSDGTPRTGEFLVNTYTTSSQSYGSVAADAEGNFVIVWGSYGPDGDESSIQGQRYSSDGNTVATEFQINTYTTSRQHRPRVAMNTDGAFVVVWHGYIFDGSYWNIHAQRYNSDGSEFGGEFQINAFTTLNQGDPDVVMDTAGGFVVVWESYGQDGSLKGIQGRRYSFQQLTSAAEFQINTYTTLDQVDPRISLSGDQALVVWTSNGQDGDAESVQGRRFAIPMFYDGFETGDTSSWSSSSPGIN